MQEAQARPPYVTFEKRETEDREASIVAGRYVAKDVIFAIVTPAGTKDRLEKVAEDWFRDLEESVKQDRFPPQWFDAYKERYAAFLKNEELPEDGTPIKGWTMASPAEVRNVLGANIRTVEDLAEATEEAMQRIGMGARALKDKAKAFLETSNGKGKVASELAALRAKNEELENTNTQLLERLTKLEEKLADTTPAE